MIHRLFFAQNRMMGAPPGTYAVTFTVKEFFIDPDNAFADTEVGVLQYMTVKIGATEVLTNASGEAVFYLAHGTHTYEVYDNDRYLTTVKGEVTVVASAESVTAKVYPCLYKPTEIATLISTDSYIPVSTDDNLNDLRTEASRIMGQGTIFEGTFTTGLDKKYIQVLNISLSDFQTGDGWDSLGVQGPINFTGVFDGSELLIYNLLINRPTENVGGLFSQSGTNSIIRNLFVYGNVTGKSNTGLLSGGILSSSSNGLIENCHGFGTVTGNNDSSLYSSGGLLGYTASPTGVVRNCSFKGTVNVNALGGGFVGGNSGTVQDCYADAEVNSSGGTGGGFVGQNNGLIQDCHAITDLTTGNSIGGGFVGDALASSRIERCYATGSVDCNYSASGGFCGTSRSGGTTYFRNCYTHCSVRGTGTQTGGFIGNCRIEHTNCYATGAITITGSAASTGGFIGVLTSGTVTNCYYDSQTTGRSDTGKGLPRTTAQMKYGTASSFINPDGSTDATEDPANAMYTSWDILIWDFGGTSDYPELI